MNTDVYDMMIVALPLNGDVISIEPSCVVKRARFYIDEMRHPLSPDDDYSFSYSCGHKFFQYWAGLDTDWVTLDTFWAW